MSKRGIVFAALVVSLLIFISLSSAFSFSDFFGKITGNVISEGCPNNLVAYYKLDNNLQDSSGNWLTGTTVGTPTSISGKLGTAYHFDGSAAIDIGNIDLSNQEFSISSWVRTTDPGQYNNYREWISKVGYWETGTFEFNIHAPNNANGIGVMGWTSGRGIYALEDRNVNLRDGNWHYVVGTYRRGSQALYVDGTLTSTNNYAGDLPITSQTVQIGGTDWHYYHHRWVGDIDEVAIYNKALTSSEVSDLYNNGHGKDVCNALPSCTENWTCSSWSTCSNSQQSRTCTDNNNCETTNSKPSITQSCSSSPGDISSGLVAHYKMDDNSSSTSVTDSSGNGNNGISRRATSSMAATGQINGALNFNGNGDYINLGNGLNFGGNSFTVSAWVKSTTIKGRGSTAQNIFVQRNNCGTGNIQFYLEDGYTCNSKPNIDFWNSNSFGANPTLCGTTAPVAARWYHLVGVYNSTDLILYIDGTKDNSIHTSGNINTAAVSSILGWDTCGSNYFNGLIDEVRIYNRAISTSEIQQLYSLTALTCTENWTCSSWSTCSNSQQSRTCTDNNNCGTITNRSALIQNCTSGDIPSCVSTCSESICSGNGFLSCLDINADGCKELSQSIVPCQEGTVCQNGICIILTENPICGNGLIELGEECDLGGSNGVCPSQCTPICTLNKDCNKLQNIQDIIYTPETTNIQPTCEGCIFNETCLPVGYRLEVEGNPSFCDITGIISQKRNTQNITQTCQNSFECESNLCSAGECVEIIGSKAILVKIICKLSHLTDEDKYLSCINQYIYGAESTPSSDQISSNQVDMDQTAPLCVSNWSCGVWSSCDQKNNKNRICYDLNNCGLDEGKPSTSEVCTSGEITAPSEIVEVTTTQQDFSWWNPSTWTGVTNSP